MTDSIDERASLGFVSPDRAARGRGIQERRAALGITSQAEFSRRTGKSRTTIAKAESGTAHDNTYLELEAWLNAEATRHRAGSLGGENEAMERFEIDFTGPTTKWKFSVSGPMDDADAVRHQAAELLREFGFGADAPEMQKEGPRAE